MKTTKANYHIEVHALGYETTTLTVRAANLKEAKKHERAAIAHWLAVNDVDWATRGMASVRYTLSEGVAK